ncbi:OppA family ABC transporter substrate-binding lipoprotein [Mycoplasma simbae]|uniref:OppA family ABC transporter substrate-binding lipoprotein n=1 Tax=Mycoplasma simbae TaxID=36744 RepID=UPI000496335B|nr:hypothetical protein [Mycoplasma simbae]
MSKFWLNLIASSSILLPIASVSCSYIQPNKNIFIIEKNESNSTLNALPMLSGVYEKRNSLHDTLSGNYLLRYAYVGESKFDYLNNYFQRDGISGKFLKFGLINSIELIDSKNQSHVFDTDSSDEFINPSDLVKRDINRGYKNYIYDLVSQNPKSINSLNFKAVLANAKTIKFNLNTNKHWYDGNAQKTNFALQGNDFANSFIQANLTLTQLNNLSLIGFNNVINPTNFEKNSIKFNLNDNKNTDLLLQEIIENKIFSAYNPDNFSIGSYVLKTNDLKHSEYVSVEKNDIAKVIIKYNPIGKVDEQTHRLHILNEYSQGLISSQEISLFNNYQQQQLISDFKSKLNNTKLSIISTFNDSNQEKLMFKDKLEHKNINNIYESLMYGSDDKNTDYNTFYTGFGFRFRNLISQLLNKYSLNYIALKTHYYDDFISPDANISNAKQTNYERVVDAIDHFNKQTLYLNNSSSLIYSHQHRDKYFDSKSFLDIFEQLKTDNFDLISQEITALLNEFYKLNNIDELKTVDFYVPLNLGLIDTNLQKIISQLFNSIDKRLSVKLVDLNSPQANKYYVKHNFKGQNTIEYLTELLNLSDNNLIYALEHIDQHKFAYLAKFKTEFIEFFAPKSVKDMDKLMNSEPIEYLNKVNEFVFKLHSKFTYFEIINLINEIKTLYSVPYNLNSNVDLDSFKYELIQPWFIKPTRADNLTYFEDIKLKEE